MQTIEFFDTAKKGYITVQDLKDKLGIFYNNLTQKDFKFLMQNKVWFFIALFVCVHTYPLRTLRRAAFIKL